MFVELLAAAALGQSAPKEPTVLYRLPDPAEVTKPEGLKTPEEWAAACDAWDDWEKPGPAFLIAPRLYYVGTCGITSLIVVTSDGNVLLDTGTELGSIMMLTTVQDAGIDRSWIRLILTSHEHFDHVGGLAHVQRVTGAPAVALPAAARVLRSGEDNSADPQAGMHDAMEPARSVITVRSGEPVRFGNIEFTPIATPGHTPGATSWQWEMCEGTSCKFIVYADSLSPVSRDDYRFSDHPDYVADYREGLQRLREIECDILLTPHPSSSKMVERAATGTFEGGMTCVKYADAVEARLAKRLASEAEAANGG